MIEHRLFNYIAAQQWQLEIVFLVVPDNNKVFGGKTVEKDVFCLF